MDGRGGGGRDGGGRSVCRTLVHGRAQARRYARTNEVVRFQNGIYPFDQIARRAACSLWPLIYRAFISVYWRAFEIICAVPAHCARVCPLARGLVFNRGGKLEWSAADRSRATLFIHRFLHSPGWWISPPPSPPPLRPDFFDSIQRDSSPPTRALLQHVQDVRVRGTVRMLVAIRHFIRLWLILFC